MSRAVLLICAAVLAALWMPEAPAQTRQKGADANAAGSDRVRVDYVGYRPCRYETEALIEPDNERPNKGGLVYVYLTNVSDRDVRLAFWRMNGKDESYWRLDGFLSWDRLYDEHLVPGESTVLELDSFAEAFGEGEPFEFAYVERDSWRPACRYDGKLEEDPVQISLIRGMPGLDGVEVHIRHRGKDDVRFVSAEIVGHPAAEVSWVGQDCDGPGHAIARLRFDKPLAPATVCIAKVTFEEGRDTRTVMAHRRIFEDWFPIGCWSNNPTTWPILSRLHIDTMVRGGRAEDDYFAQVAPKYDFHAMVPAGRPVAIDQMLSLRGHDRVACWMLADEPDWHVPPVVMLCSDDAVRRYDSSAPTFITLCRNVKFFEYAPIADIPCHDHYCVTAPTSSQWPKLYGTYLEETGYYTRDLKRAAEPKPIWVWSQGIAGWGERPKRPVPTPNELLAQLFFNIGRGAKGIIWFNYDHERAEAYPDAREAMQQWGRVMLMARGDFVASEPLEAEVKASKKVDVAALVTWDKVLLCIVNQDYEIDPEAYPFKTKKKVEITVPLPAWLEPSVALELSPDGVGQVPLKMKRGNKAEIEVGDLECAKLIVLPNDAAVEDAYRARYAEALSEERE